MFGIKHKCNVFFNKFEVDETRREGRGAAPAKDDIIISHRRRPSHHEAVAVAAAADHGAGTLALGPAPFMRRRLLLFDGSSS